MVNVLIKNKHSGREVTADTWGGWGWIDAEGGLCPLKHWGEVWAAKKGDEARISGSPCCLMCDPIDGVVMVDVACVSGPDRRRMVRVSELTLCN